MSSAPQRQEVCDHGIETASVAFQKGVEGMVQVREQEWGGEKGLHLSDSINSFPGGLCTRPRAPASAGRASREVNNLGNHIWGMESTARPSLVVELALALPSSSEHHLSHGTNAGHFPSTHQPCKGTLISSIHSFLTLGSSLAFFLSVS